HHQVLHRGVSRAHQDHRQRHHPAQRTGRRRLLRPGGVAGTQDPAPHQALRARGRPRRARPAHAHPPGTADAPGGLGHRPQLSGLVDGRAAPVTRFLSPEWIAAFNEALVDVVIAPPGPDAGLAVRDGRFSMGQVVTGGPDGDVQATLRVLDGRVTMTDGEASDAAVTIRLTWADALSMAAGELAPADAIAAGRVRVRGDLSVLAEAQAVLGKVQGQLQGLRDVTEY